MREQPGWAVWRNKTLSGAASFHLQSELFNEKESLPKDPIKFQMFSGGVCFSKTLQPVILGRFCPPVYSITIPVMTQRKPHQFHFSHTLGGVRIDLSVAPSQRSGHSCMGVITYGASGYRRLNLNQTVVSPRGTLLPSGRSQTERGLYHPRGVRL